MFENYKVHFLSDVLLKRAFSFLYLNKFKIQNLKLVSLKITIEG